MSEPAKKGARSSASSRAHRNSKTRYATLGFSTREKLDAMWPVAFALNKLTATEEARISALVKKAAS